jgi:hypothetical protein
MHGRNGERMRHTRTIVTHYGEPDRRSLRIHDAVQVERWRGYWSLTKGTRKNNLTDWVRWCSCTWAGIRAA